MTIVGFEDVNYYENRNAYKIPKFDLESILKKSYQDNMEYAFSDQTLLSTTMKKGYNFLTMFANKMMADNIFMNDCEGRYISVGNKVLTFGCDNNIVYYDSYVSDSKDVFDNRISNINNVVENTNVDVYIYYIEKDTDINFEKGIESDIFDYLKENINSDDFYGFQVNSFDDFKNYFYRTDHHWNYKGSYTSYLDLVNILTNEEPMKYNEEVCLNSDFSGSKANFSGASFLYKEEFCVYNFDFPDYLITVNGEVGSYGAEEYHLKNPELSVSYGSFYGGDNGEIIFDNNDSSKENILI